MEIDYCRFPDNLLYDSEGFIWLSKENNIARIGVTSIYSALAGKVSSVVFKDVREIEKGRGICSIESPTHFSIAKVPIKGEVIQVNSELARNPWLINDSPYGDGWLALIEPTQLAVDGKDLFAVHNSRKKFLAQIKNLRIRCFAAFPDHEMFEIGVECAMVLAKLNDLMTKVPVGDVVHVVSDDATTPIEMRRWTEQTGQKIVEIRKEGNLYHVIVRKVI
ncbi:MAG: hypothetical protein FJ358_05100 [Thaumarchaeota archaeon]|nr:hypothetical protein [Nitrososphaerota archaeon]